MSLDNSIILLPIWKGKEITRLCLDNLARLKDIYGFEVMCVVSESWAKFDAFDRGFKWVEVPNDDLGHKMNVGVEAVMKFGYDYMINLGSDDIIDERLFEIYKPYFEKRTPMFGITKATFIDTVSNECKVCDYQILIGAGRAIRTDLIEQFVMRDGKSIMYDKGINRGLDMNSMKKFKCSHTEIETEDHLIIDLKSNKNIWTFDNIGGTECSFDSATKNLDTELIDEILEL